MSENTNTPDASKAQEIMNAAKQMASQIGNTYVTLEHVMMILLNEKPVVKALFKVGGSDEVIKDLATELMMRIQHFPTSMTASAPRKNNDIIEVTELAANKALFEGSKKIGAMDIFDAILSLEDSSIKTILRNIDIDPVDLKEYIVENADAESLESEEEDLTELDMPASERLLRKYCKNYNELVDKKTIDPVFGREREIDEMIITLSRKYKKNIVLTGKPGVGKTAIVEGLASKIVSGDVPEALKNATVWELDSTAVVAGAKFRGDMEERMKNIIKALEKSENPILFIDEIHTIIGAGESSNGGMDMANILKPALARGSFKCIGATTDEEFRKYFEKDKALVRRFRKIKVEEPSIEMATEILKGVAPSYEEYHGVKYNEDAIEAMVVLSDRYITNKFLPDKAIDVMDVAGATLKIKNQILGENNPVTVDDVQAEISKIARIPSVAVKEDEAHKLQHLETDLKKSVFDQDKAVETLTNSVLLARSGLRPRHKTLGNYLLVGPSGTGKTETCKQLSETLSMKLVRIDMSEYMEPHSISKLIGSPPGYIGYGDGEAGNGIIINALDENPHCILLLDEIEKAHPSVFNLFLQVMDDGVISSSSGKKIDCSNIILAMTSNVGAASAAAETIGFAKNVSTSKIAKAVENTFTPEFRNRLDAIIEFNPLSKETMIKIVDKFLDGLSDLAKEKNVVINVNDDVKDYLARKGYDPKMGARPASRLIDNVIKIPLSKEILFGKLKNGGIATITLNDNNVEFSYS